MILHACAIDLLLLFELEPCVGRSVPDFACFRTERRLIWKCPRVNPGFCNWFEYMEVMIFVISKEFSPTCPSLGQHAQHFDITEGVCASERIKSDDFCFETCF